MAKQKKERSIGERLRDLLAELDRLLNPPQPIPVRIPARVRQRE